MSINRIGFIGEGLPHCLPTGPSGIASNEFLFIREQKIRFEFLKHIFHIALNSLRFTKISRESPLRELLEYVKYTADTSLP